MQMKTSCGILKEQLALLSEQLDKIHAVVETSRIDAARIEKVIQDMHSTLILSFDEGQELENLWNTLDNFTFVYEDIMGVVDPLDSVLTFIMMPIPLEICNEVCRGFRCTRTCSHLTACPTGEINVAGGWWRQTLIYLGGKQGKTSGICGYVEGIRRL